MSASTVEIRLPFAVEGIRRFFTTNGDAFLSRQGRFLYLHDSVILLRLQLGTREVAWFEPGAPFYIDVVTETRRGLTLELSNRRSNRRTRHLTAEDLTFSEGLGRVKDTRGLLPSAWEPAVRSILRTPS